MLSSKLSHLSLTKPDFLSTLKFQSCLGQGGFGIVFKAMDINPSSFFQETAVKFMFPAEYDEKEQQQILRECILATKFNHENVVHILTATGQQLDADEIEKIFENVPEDDDHLQTLRDTLIVKARRRKTIESICIQMQLCGENLRKWLHQERDTNNDDVQALQIYISHGIVSGLKYLHDNKIVHRDLKPENIMFSGEKFQLPVKIGDFGLCRHINSPEMQVSTLTSRVGTPDYMAPEAFTNDYSFQADLYSLGLIIFEIFQYIKVHERKNLLHKLVNEWEEDLLIGIKSHEVQKVVFNLTRKRKTDRTQSTDEIVGIFESMRASEELKTQLRNVANAGIVVVMEGLYEGAFVLEQDNVEIVGAGGGTILKGLKEKTCLVVRGSGCTISDIKVVSSGVVYQGIGIDVQGSGNRIQNVVASGGATCFNVQGEANRLENLTISDAKSGILVEGCRHIVDHVKMDNIRNCGISIGACSDHNEVSNVTATNFRHGILVEGSSNNFCNISLKQKSWSGLYGMRLFGGGSNNSVSMLTCSDEYPSVWSAWGLEIDSSGTTVNDSKCGSVFVRGNNTTLTNVDCGEKLEIRADAHSVNLTNCGGKLLKVVAPREEVTTTNCIFDKILEY